MSRGFYKDGIRFQCQGSGKCCSSHGEYGFVYMNLEDRRRMANHLKMKTSAFTKKYCENTSGSFHLKDNVLKDGSSSPECLFLKGKGCTVYEGRPTQCRTWPFWPEVMNAKSWSKDVVSFCPGINKGRKYTASEIKNILEEQRVSELNN